MGLLIALGEEPTHNDSLDRLVDWLAEVGRSVEPLPELRLKTLSRMTTASRHPDGEEAPVDLFDAVDCAEAPGIAGAVLEVVRQALDSSPTGRWGEGVQHGAMPNRITDNPDQWCGIACICGQNILELFAMSGANGVGRRQRA
jgi:hypothetical protein